MKLKVIKIRNKKLRFFAFYYDKKMKEFYLSLWLWLIISYRDDVN